MSDELQQLKERGQSALAERFEAYREPLERMIEFRMDQRLRGRIDPLDVLQETWLDASRRLHEWIEKPSVSLFVWFRQLAYQALIDLHRKHFGQKRDPRMEIHLLPQRSNDATSECILAALYGPSTSPSQAVSKMEEFERLRLVLASMEETDREVLALRHFEQLSNLQVAETLGISPTAASNRYVRAMMRLSQIASNLLGGDASHVD